MLKGIILFFFLFSAHAADNKAQVMKTLGNLSGCFEVQYEFVEDGNNDKKYSPIYEWIRVKESASDDKVLEHIGQYPLFNDDGSRRMDRNGNQMYMSQYHWREHWTEVEDGIWKQVVFGPFTTDNFRYECEGRWKKGQFHCHTGKAAKPRRDRKRPYEYMKRINNLQINGKQWVHGQRNYKYTKNDELYSTEMGWNTYKRVDDEVCKQSRDSNAQPMPRD